MFHFYIDLVFILILIRTKMKPKSIVCNAINISFYSLFFLVFEVIFQFIANLKGERGIRTLGSYFYAGFQGRSLQPLGHLSCAFIIFHFLLFCYKKIAFYFTFFIILSFLYKTYKYVNKIYQNIYYSKW